MMDSIQIDNTKKKVIIKDQNKKILWFLRVIFALNVLNSIIFYLIFNTEDGALRWLWLVFAIVNVLLLYFSFTLFSQRNQFEFKEIVAVQNKSILGLLIELKSGKYRKLFLSSTTEEAQLLMKKFAEVP